MNQLPPSPTPPHAKEGRDVNTRPVGTERLVERVAVPRWDLWPMEELKLYEDNAHLFQIGKVVNNISNTCSVEVRNACYARISDDYPVGATLKLSCRNLIFPRTEH